MGACALSQRPCKETKGAAEPQSLQDWLDEGAGGGSRAGPARSRPPSNALDDRLFDPEARRWVEDCLREAEQKEDPRVAVIGERGVGKSSLINSLRGLRPGVPRAAGVGADEVVCKEQADAGAFYRDAGLIYQDIPGCRGSELDTCMGDAYIRRFKLNTADICLFVYVAVLNADIIACARTLLEQGVAVYFVRNKVDVDCRNEVEDGNAASEEDALAMIRQRAYAQMSAKGLQGQADEAHLFLISAKYIQAVGAEPPRFDFQRLKAALEGSIRDEAKRSQVKQIFLKNAKALAECRGNECKQLLSCYVAASVAAGAIPVPGVSQVGDMAILAKACQQFQWIFCLAEPQISTTDLAGIGAYLMLKTSLSLPFILAVSNAGLACADGLAWVPVVGVPFSMVLGAGVSGVGMCVALSIVVEKMQEVAEAVYAFELEDRPGAAASGSAALRGLIDGVFPEAAPSAAGSSPQPLHAVVPSA